MLPKFVLYLLQSSSVISKIDSATIGSTVKNTAIADLKRVQIPIPPLEIQAKTVEMLDKFDTLVNSATEELPREMELRQKQFEYYRAKLLDFPHE